MEFHLRPARPSDGAAVAAIYDPVVRSTAVSFETVPPGAEEMARRIERVSASHPWLVAESATGVQGYAYATAFRARPAYARTAETSVYLAEGARGQGLGRLLMEALLEDLQRRGFHRAVAGATLPNDASAGLHEALGFSFVGVFHQVGYKFDAWHDVGFWEIALVGPPTRPPP